MVVISEKKDDVQCSLDMKTGRSYYRTYKNKCEYQFKINEEE